MFDWLTSPLLSSAVVVMFRIVGIHRSRTCRTAGKQTLSANHTLYSCACFGRDRSICFASLLCFCGTVDSLLHEPFLDGNTLRHMMRGPRLSCGGAVQEQQNGEACHAFVSSGPGTCFGSQGTGKRCHGFAPVAEILTVRCRDQHILYPVGGSQNPVSFAASPLELPAPLGPGSTTIPALRHVPHSVPLCCASGWAAIASDRARTRSSVSLAGLVRVMATSASAPSESNSRRYGIHPAGSFNIGLMSSHRASSVKPSRSASRANSRRTSFSSKMGGVGTRHNRQNWLRMAFCRFCQ